MRFRIAGIGTAVPDEFVTQDDAAHHAVETWGSGAGRTATIPALYRRSGVRTRHSVVLEASTNGEPARQSFYQPAKVGPREGPSTADRMQCYEAQATDLAVRAARAAIDDAGLGPESIAHLVTVSCSGFSAPGIDVGMIERLRMRRNVTRTHVGFMGCHGAFNALRVASALSEGDAANYALVCCVELCTLHQQYTTDPQQIVANALFGDGAAALVGGAPESHSNATASDVNVAAEASVGQNGARRHVWHVLDQRSIVLPDSEDLMSWRVGDHGFVMSLSPRVPEMIRGSLRPWMADWLADHRLAIDEIGSWAVHPGGPRILTACAESLGLDRAMLETSRQVLARYGNMSSPTVLFILERLRDEHLSGGNRQLPCVALAFGPGLTIEAALIG